MGDEKGESERSEVFPLLVARLFVSLYIFYQVGKETCVPHCTKVEITCIHADTYTG